MNKIMILGAGNAQYDAIIYCKSLGMTVYGCSNAMGYKNIDLFDEFVLIDVKDINKICDNVEKNKIDFVYSIGSDIAIPAAMRVSEILNLPHFLSYETAKICQNKSYIRAFLGEDFKGNLPFKIYTNLQDAGNYQTFPCMMKPVDTQAQRGCFKINNHEELKKSFQVSLDYSFSKQVILEKYINGPEVSVNGFIDNGKIVFSLISDRIVFDDYPGGIIKEHHLPSKSTTPIGKQNIQILVKNLIHKLGIMNGPVYFQIKMEGDTPYLIEITPRLDGCHLWNLIKHYCGIDLLEATFIKLIYPEKKYHFDFKEPYDTLKLKFMCEKPGNTFEDSKYSFNKESLLHIRWYYSNGDVVMKQNGWMEKCGYLICP